jgi:non-canonical (house-cleaning) NTP pyrophosphatase
MSDAIVIGSNSNLKIRAVIEACKAAGLDVSPLGIHTLSGQNEQPVGFQETYNGALTRAKAAKAHHLPNEKVIGVGIENGIIFLGASPRVTLDFAVIVIIDKNHRHFVSTCSGIQFPEECVTEAMNQGFSTTTVGSVIAKKFGGDPEDPHGRLTSGFVPRAELLKQGILVALLQMKVAHLSE